MAIVAPKILFFSSLALFAGGIVAGTNLLPNIKEKKSDLKTELDPVTPTTELQTIVFEVVKKCLIFKTDVPSGNRVTRILEKFEGKEEFYLVRVIVRLLMMLRMHVKEKNQRAWMLKEMFMCIRRAMEIGFTLKICNKIE